MTAISTVHASNVCPCKGHPNNCYGHPHDCGCTDERKRPPAPPAPTELKDGTPESKESKLVVYREWIDKHNQLRQTRVGDLKDYNLSTFFDDVNDWHRKMGLPVTEQGRDPDLVSEQDFRYRMNFLFEEIREFIEADAKLDLPEVADSLADIIWVVCGTACYYGIPLNEVWAEIRRANNEKRPWREGDPVKPRNYVAGEIVKPEGWNPPDIASIIDKFVEDNGMMED